MKLGLSAVDELEALWHHRQIELGHTVTPEPSRNQVRGRHESQDSVSTQIKINQLVRSNTLCGIILRPEKDFLQGLFREDTIQCCLD